MTIFAAVRTALVVLASLAIASSPGHADSGYVSLTIYMAGWIIGGSGGSGTLTFHSPIYGLSTSGLDYGLLFGGSKTAQRGRVRNIRRPADVEGVYAPALPSALDPARSC